MHVKIDFSEVDAVSPFVAEFGVRSHLDDKTVQYVTLAIEELLANSIRHGHPQPDGKSARIHIECVADRLSVTFVDSGVAFDPTAIIAQPVPDSVDEARVGGLGILMIRQMFDRFMYERRGPDNRVFLEKTIAPTTAPPAGP